MIKHAALFAFTLFTVIVAVAGEKAIVNLNIGDTAPVLQAKDDRGQDFNSQSLLGEQNLVVYFYPAAMTGGCTAQACAFRDDQQEFAELNTLVVGVSGDSVQNLAWFKQTNNLNFPLLADPDGSIARAFGVPTRDGGEIVRQVDEQDVKLIRGVTASRWTFIIDKKGTIIYKDTDVNAAEDSDKVLAFLKQHTSEK
ncbi:peroxiredoxin [candidate division KSB1 bacterium]|nr:peroxiredoxin [candidate division KSB1 bacterium]